MTRYYTKEEIEQAKSSNLIEVMQKLGLQLKKSGGDEYCLVDHDSLKISHNAWCWHSRDRIGGNVVDFLMKYPDFNYSFTAAVGTILELNGINNLYVSEPLSEYRVDSSKQKNVMILPAANQTNNRVIAYLNKTRGIDYQLIRQMIKENKLFEDSINHNVIFIGYDKHGVARYGFKRGTVTGSSRYAGDLEGSDKSYGFKIEGTTDSVCVFEAPIDALSYITIHKLQKMMCKDNLLSLGCSSEGALERYLSENPNIKKIKICTDNDKAGIACGNRIEKNYGDKYCVQFLFPMLKDYNEDLIQLLKKNNELTIL